MIGDNKEMAEAVNHVGDGLQNAVKETLKSERLKADLITNVSHDIKERAFYIYYQLCGSFEEREYTGPED